MDTWRLSLLSKLAIWARRKRCWKSTKTLFLRSPNKSGISLLWWLVPSVTWQSGCFDSRAWRRLLNSPKRSSKALFCFSIPTLGAVMAFKTGSTVPSLLCCVLWGKLLSTGRGDFAIVVSFTAGQKSSLFGSISGPKLTSPLIVMLHFANMPSPTWLLPV